MKTNPLATTSTRRFVQSLPYLAALVSLVFALPAAAASLQLDFTAPSSFNESNRQAVLEWNAEPAKIYVVQSTDDLSASTAWKTEEPVRATSAGTLRWIAPETIRFKKYYRLILPQPEVFSVEPAFVDSNDPGALFYLIGQCLPTNGTIVINGQNFTPTLVDTNGGWVAISLNGLPPGTPVIGNILVLDNGSNIVATVPLQSPVLYGAEPTREQLQGPPDELPASPRKKEFKGHVTLLKRGGDTGGAAARHTKTGHVTLLKRSDASRAILADEGETCDDGEDCDDADASLLMPALMKAKEKANRASLRPIGGGDNDCDDSDISLAIGELRCQETDLAVPGVGLDFAWTRTYRSRTGAPTAQGQNWDFSYNVSLSHQPDGTVQLRPGNGRTDTFYPNGTNGWARDEYFVEIRDLDDDGAPDSVIFADSGKWLFNPLGTPGGGKLSQIVDRNGNTISLYYDLKGQCDYIVDTLGRTNDIAYNAGGLVESVTDFSGRMVRYEYDGNGDLTACISPPVIGTPNGNDFPGGKTNRYTYSSGFPAPQENHLLLSKVDGKGQFAVQVNYDHNLAGDQYLRCTSIQNGTNPPARLYWKPQNILPGSYAVARCIINDPVGNVTEAHFDSRQRCVVLQEFTGRAIVGALVTDVANRPTGKLRADDPDYFETRCEWNADSLCTRVVYPRGDATEMVFQRAFNQNDSRSNRRHAGDLRILRELACCNGADLDGDGLNDITERSWHFEYDPNFGSGGALCYETTCPGKVVYDFAGIVPQVNGVAINTKGTGADKNRVLPTVNKKVAIKTKGTGADKNRVANPGATGDCDDTDDDCDSFVTSITDPRGIVTRASYDTNGNLLRVTWTVDTTPPVVDLAYNPRGQLTAITNAADATGFRRVDAVSYYTNGPQTGYLKSVVIDDRDFIGLRLTTTHEYDAVGNVTRLVDPRGNDWKIHNNALNQRVRVESPTNLTARCVTDYLYDANDNLVQCVTELRDETDALRYGHVVAIGHDYTDRIISVTEQVSTNQFITNRFIYDANDNVVAAHSPLAVSGADPTNIVTFEYDERGLLFRKIPAPGSGASPTNEWSYDSNGKVKRVKVELYVEEMRRDGFGRPSSITDAMSNVVTYAYDRNDNLVFKRIDAEPNDQPGSAGNLRYHEWRWRYNTLNQCVESRGAFFDPLTQLPIGDGFSVTTFSNAPNGQLVSVTDDNNRTTRYAYDPAGRLSSTTDAKTNIVSYTYDEGGNILTVTQNDRSDLTPGAQQFFMVRGYDRMHRLTHRYDNVGNTNRYAYDSFDNLVSAVDPRGNETVFAYDGLSRCVQTTCYEGIERGITISTSHVEYDSNSRISSVTDANTNTTFYAYDAMDRLIQTTEADGTVSSLVWSPRSNLIREQDANGTIITNTYDLLDRCVRREITPGPGVAGTTTFESFAYDGLSRLVAATNDASYTIVAYDTFGNPGPTTQDGLTTSSTYDSLGNRLSMTYPGGRVVTYSYDALNQITNVSSGAGGLPPTMLASFAYDGPGRLGRSTRANNVNTRIQWNGLVNPPNTGGDFGWSQVSGINHQVAFGGPVIDQRRAAYDQNQNKTLRAQTVPFFQGGELTTNVFQYDAVDRLSRAINTKGTGATVRMYVLDGNDNRQLVLSNGVAEFYVMEATIPPGDFQMNQYTVTPFGAQSYDENGNLVGRVAPGSELHYEYDYAGRLVSVSEFGGGLPVPVASFSYDALGRRVSKTSYPSGQPPVTTQYVYDHPDDDCDGVIIETRENGTLRASFARPHIIEKSGCIMFNSGNQPLYFHEDDLGNVLALTDVNGIVVERYEYDDFGHPSFLSSDGFPLATNASPVGNPFLFHGMEWEPELGWYHVRDYNWRSSGGQYHDPKTGRMINHGMPNRISMNVTVPKQTQGATFGEKVNQGLQAAGSALNNPWSSGGTKAQDHNSSRSNKSSSRAQDHNSSRSNKTASSRAQDHNSSRSNKTASTKAQDHNSSRSNKTASSIAPGGGGGGGGGVTGKLIVPVAMDKGLRFSMGGSGLSGKKHTKSGHVTLLK